MVVQQAILIRRWRWVGENGEGGRTWTRTAAMRAYERSTSAN